MAKCERCGKKGLFLKLSSYGYCDECTNALFGKTLVSKIETLEEERELLFMRYAREWIERFGWLPAEASDGHPVKYKYSDVQLYVPDDFNLDDCSDIDGLPVFFYREEDNEYDARALLVVTETGKRLGYIHKGKMQDMIHDFMDEDLPILSTVDAIDIDAREVSLKVFFYR